MIQVSGAQHYMNDKTLMNRWEEDIHVEGCRGKNHRTVGTWTACVLEDSVKYMDSRD